MGDTDKESAQLALWMSQIARRVARLETRVAELESSKAVAALQEETPATPAAEFPAPPAQPVPPMPPMQPGWPPAQAPAYPQNVRQGVSWNLPPIEGRYIRQPAEAAQPPRAPVQPPAAPVAAGLVAPVPAAPTPATPTPAAAAAAPAFAGETRHVTRVTPGEPISTGPRFSLGSIRDLESQLTGRLLAWVGGAAVVLGAIFFLSLAFSRGWIGPEARVALGCVAGVAATGLGAFLFDRRQSQLGHVLIAVGLGIASMSLFAGTRLYGLYPPELALAGSFILAVMAAAIAIRYDSQVLAIYGLLAIAAAPPVMGAGASLVTIVFLGVTVVGTTAISLVRSWRWLPPTAFLITAPQLLYWITARPEAIPALSAIGAYWLLHAVAASADELREEHPDVEFRAEALFMANSLVALVGGMYLLGGGLASWQGLFLALAAAAHFAFGGYVALKRGDTYPFGLFVNAIGAAVLALAIERQFDGPAVAIGWAFEGAALAVVFGYRRNAYAGAAAAVMGALGLAHLAIYEYVWLDWNLYGTSASGHAAFVDPAGLTLAGLLIAAAVSAFVSRRDDVRIGLMVASWIVAAYSLPFELSGAALVAGWAAEAVVLILALKGRRMAYLGLVAAGIAALAIAHLVAYEYPWFDWNLAGSTGSGPIPFANSSGLALGCLLAAALATGILSATWRLRYALLVAGTLLIAYAMPFELAGPALVAGWCVEVLALAFVARSRLSVLVWESEVDEGSRRVIIRPASGLMTLALSTVPAALGLAHLVFCQYVASDWLLTGRTGTGLVPFADNAGLVLFFLLATGLVVAIVSNRHDLRCGLATLALLLVAYSLPFELTGLALVAGWAVLLPASIAAETLLDRLPGVPGSRAALRNVAVVDMASVDWPDSPLLATVVSAVLVLWRLLAVDLPISRATAVVVPATPFADLTTAAALTGVAAFLLAAKMTPRADLRVVCTLVAASVAAYLMVFELALPYAVVAWCGIAAALGAWSLVPQRWPWAHQALGALLVAMAAIMTLVEIVPPDRLGVRPGVALTGAWFMINSTLAVVAVAACLVAASRFLTREPRIQLSLDLSAGIALVYLASALLVDVFQGQVGGDLALEELQKQAQVGVSILWALIGLAAFIAGVIRWRSEVREAGLGLLALSTAKVFVFDLSYLDVAYRVLSLIGVGILLLAGAYAYQTLKPKKPAENQAHGHPL